ncbi:LytR/AlgR family response regulator transcription factor [Enterococcus sp. LJL128]|uniref:LytR/AlgR family response regulator transcription factor n=1 Tax=Enterococcus sp. LJL51 TaxID=3416656 RepID=UPI003CF8D7C6
MPIKVYICEDSPKQREVIEKAVLSHILFSKSMMSLAYSTDSAEELLSRIDRRNELNVYFLDIDLHKGEKINNGLELAQEIRTFDPVGVIIFITVHSELTYLTFQYMVSALDFIVKSPNIDISSRIRKCLKVVEDRAELVANASDSGIQLSTNNGFVNFLFSDILYLSTNKSHIITLHSTDNQEYQIYHKTLNILEQDLKDHFIRCHRSFLVNSRGIFSISKNFSELIMRNGVQIPIATRKKAIVRKMYEQSVQ